MIKYDIKTLFDFMDACADIESKTKDGAETQFEFNLLNDIDFNDEQYSSYWVNRKNIFSLSSYGDGSKVININGNGFSLKNMYIVNGYMFYVYISSGGSFTINFNNLTIEAIYNRNSIDLDPDGIGLINTKYWNSRDTYYNFTNCVFNIKMFAGTIINGYGSEKLIKQTDSNHIKILLSGCIFSIDYYRLHNDLNNSIFRFVGDEYPSCDHFSNKKIIIEYSQFYIKLFLSEREFQSTTTINNTTVGGLIQQSCINNCFIIVDIMSKTSSMPFNILYNNNFFNTYFLLRDKSKNSQEIEIGYSYNEYSSNNNWYHIENSEGSSGVTLKNLSSSSIDEKFIEVPDNTNAKDAKWLVDNIGFIVKV